MNPRKSSTSSGNPPSPRPRYLGIEVAGEPPVSPRWAERELARALGPATGPAPPLAFRVIRWEGGRGLVEVGHRDAARAREMWNTTILGPEGQPRALRTLRTYGTLRKGKQWLRPRPTGAPRAAPAPANPGRINTPSSRT